MVTITFGRVSRTSRTTFSRVLSWSQVSAVSGVLTV
jgi:hypothetical protein